MPVINLLRLVPTYYIYNTMCTDASIKLAQVGSPPTAHTTGFLQENIDAKNQLAVFFSAI